MHTIKQLSCLLPMVLFLSGCEGGHIYMSPVHLCYYTQAGDWTGQQLTVSHYEPRYCPLASPPDGMYFNSVVSGQKSKSGNWLGISASVAV